MDDCVFCKIIKGEIPSYKIYENEFAYAFLDIANDIDGHTLVIPKKHCKNILDCDEKTLTELIKVVKIISNHYVNNCGYEGVNILNANEACAQQSVFHFHFHILPRKTNDGCNGFPKLLGAQKDVKEMYQKLKF